MLLFYGRFGGPVNASQRPQPDTAAAIGPPAADAVGSRGTR
jgi:hypothetical protein